MKRSTLFRTAYRKFFLSAEVFVQPPVGCEALHVELYVERITYEVQDIG